MKPENLEMAIEVIKGAAAALDLVAGDLADLEQTELFQALTDHNISQIASDASSYLNTLRQVKTLTDNNGGKLPADDPSIKQQLRKAGFIGQGMEQVDNDYSSQDGDDQEFKTALNGALGYNFL